MNAGHRPPQNPALADQPASGFTLEMPEPREFDRRSIGAEMGVGLRGTTISLVGRHRGTFDIGIEPNLALTTPDLGHIADYIGVAVKKTQHTRRGLDWRRPQVPGQDPIGPPCPAPGRRRQPGTEILPYPQNAIRDSTVAPRGTSVIPW